MSLSSPSLLDPSPGLLGLPGRTLALAALAMALIAPVPADAAAGRPGPAAAPTATLGLHPCPVNGKGPPGSIQAECGALRVPENRAKRHGRTLELGFMILPALEPGGREPVFILGGGPGQAATDLASAFASSPVRRTHAIVLLDLRGTGKGNRLDCELPGSDQDLQGYLALPYANPALFRRCRDRLEAVADLSQYTTIEAMRDVDDLRRALDLGRIDLLAGSYGTRAALIYMRLFGRHVSSAFLTGLAPIGARAPLFHALAAQQAFDGTIAECTADPKCKAAFPDSRGDLQAILERLSARPATVKVHHPVSGQMVDVELTRASFAEGLRVMLYSSETGRRLPWLLSKARGGDLSPFADAWLGAARATRSLPIGTYLSVTCSEDTDRITPAEADRRTRGTFLGNTRVSSQLKACRMWPRAPIPAWYYKPWTSNVPAVLVSGRLDPVTPSWFADEFARYLPNNIRIVGPGAHVDNNQCLTGIEQALFDTHDLTRLPVECVSEEKNPPFFVPQ